MNMTLGEFIAKQAKEGKDSAIIPEELLPPGAKEALKSIADIKKKMEEPLKKQAEMAKSAYNIIAPHLDRIAEMNKLVEENYIIPERRAQNVRIINTEDFSIGSSKKENNAIIESYSLPKNANWESLIVQFLDGHVVRVSYPNMKSRKFDFNAMGFMNTKTNKPDLKWKLLMTMAENGGALTKSKWNKEFGRNVKYELNERLKKFFDMDSSPISHYTKKDGYQALFSLKGEK